MRDTTLCFLLRGGKILLAMKKRGFGKGKWNGVGGKAAAGEAVIETAVREAREEIGVALSPSALEKKAELTFVFPAKPEWNRLCHVFFARKWRGEPVESEEMRPQWFSADSLPFDLMWSDDLLWLPRALAGERLKARFHFTQSGGLKAHFIRRFPKGRRFS